ncbi:MAG: DUF2752 domain-containing protein [Planctomycetota bacterium]|nr:DUF2752 domain-containing protein [Planctomycetota bacterium]
MSQVEGEKVAAPDGDEDLEEFSEKDADDSSGEFEIPDEMYHSYTFDREQLVLALFVLVMSLLLEVNPAGNGVTLFGIDMPESCTYKQFTDQNCAGCGLTRSFIHAIRFSPETFDMNRVGFIWLIVILAQIPYRSWRIIQTRRMIRLGLVDLGLDANLWFWRLFRRALIFSLLGNWIFNLIYQKGPP